MKQMLKNTKGIILDLDGTILDSSWVWEMVDIKFLGDRGFEVPDDYVESISPMGAEKAAIYTIERFGLHNEKPEDLVREWFDMAKAEYRNKVVCKPSVRELFIPALDREGILQYFNVIVTVDEVEKGKGFPDIYEEAARRICVPVEQCVVFEDIITAVRGAKSGGFKVVAVEDEKSLCNADKIKQISDFYISSYKQLLF